MAPSMERRGCVAAVIFLNSVFAFTVYLSCSSIPEQTFTKPAAHDHPCRAHSASNGFSNSSKVYCAREKLKQPSFDSER
mgnify:CR=1 FL=1